jgi:DNA-binding FrmR family transcriptional regulator
MDPETRDEIVRRLRSIEGHVRGIERMLERDCGCLDLIRQTLAVRQALSRVSRLLVSSHLRTCVAAEGAAEEAAERQRALEELLAALELSGRL